MSKDNPLSILETLKRYFESKNTTTSFNPLAADLTELYANYQSLIDVLNSCKSSITDENLHGRLLAMEFSLKESSFDLLQIIENITGRELTVHVSKSDENLLKIAQKYHCDILELLELNKIKKIYSIEEGKSILVPSKNFQP